MNNDSILALPLFQGINSNDIDEVRNNGYLCSSQLRKGLTLINEGDKPDALTIVTSGVITRLTDSDDHSYRMEETLYAPLLIEPEHLFGISQRYTSTYITATAVNVTTISKASVIEMMEKSMIFRINVLNTLSTLSHKRHQTLWHQQSSDIPKRIIRFIKDHCSYPAGQKQLHISMLDFAKELGCSRLEISKALHILEDKELIKICRQRIEIPMLELLLRQL